MSDSILHISKSLKKKINEVCLAKFGIEAKEAGLILLQNHKNEYKKAGIDVASDVISFVLFDNNLKKIGVIKRSEIQNKTTTQN